MNEIYIKVKGLEGRIGHIARSSRADVLNHKTLLLTHRHTDLIILDCIWPARA